MEQSLKRRNQVGSTCLDVENHLQGSILIEKPLGFFPGSSMKGTISTSDSVSTDKEEVSLIAKYPKYLKIFSKKKN
jgi:hypothetical protein